MNKLNEFRLKLADLMEQYSVEIEANDVYPGCPECGTDIRIFLCYNGEFTNGEYQPSQEVEFGRYLDARVLRNMENK